MSGPKALSCREFNKALNAVFRLQHRISKLMTRLSQFKYRDERSKLSLDSGDFTDKNRKKAEKLCRTFQPEYVGTAREHRQILAKQESLKIFLHQCETADHNLRKEEARMKRYATYLRHRDSCLQGFREYRETAAKHIREVLQGEAAEKAAEEILSLDLILEETAYSDSFTQGTAEQLEQACDASNYEKTGAIDRIRMRYLDSSLATTFHAEIRDTGLSDSPLKDEEKLQQKQLLLGKLQQCIGAVEDRSVQQKYKMQLDKLISGETFSDPWYYAELLEEISVEEENRKHRIRVAEILHKLDESVIPKILDERVQKIRLAGASLLNNRKITVADMQVLQEDTDLLYTEIEMEEERAAISRRQNLFLKENLINGLQSLGYRMADDTRIIDFAETDDFVLDIPDQDNYLNIRFSKKTGDFLYNFLIPEKKDSLDSGQTKEKLAEMQSACDDFREILKELDELGIHTDITRDIPISEAALLQLPEKLRNRILQKRKMEGAQDKKKYLDQP